MFDNITPKLRRALGVFAVVIIATAIVTSLSFVYMDDIYSDQLSAKRGMNKWKAKINSSVENNQIIEEYESNFLKLVNQGVVGSENRLSWFETIQNTTKKRGMPSVKYSISSQEAVKENSIKREYKGIDVFKSVMILDIKMAHEGDLFALLNDLGRADGLFAVERCDIEKIRKENTDVANDLKAYCELGWYTFRGSRARRAGRNAG
jgi:hypothetical protein